MIREEETVQGEMKKKRRQTVGLGDTNGGKKEERRTEGERNKARVQHKTD